MAKVRVKDIKGIITNYDENDLSLESLTSSKNFKFENNWVEVEHPNVVLDENMVTLASGYVWEDGISAILSSDTLSESDTSFQKEIIFLSAKKIVNNTIKRKFYVKVNGAWVDLAEIASWITEDMLTTTKVGDVFFAAEEGRLKIYLPHDSFWLGYIDRKLYTPKLLDWTAEGNGRNMLYFDRLIEKFDFDVKNAFMHVYSPTLSLAELTESYRLGAVITPEEYGSTETIVGDAVTFIEVEADVSEYPAYAEDFKFYKVQNTVTGAFIVYPGSELAEENMTAEDPSLIWWFRTSGGSDLIFTTIKIFDGYLAPTNSNISYSNDASPYEQMIDYHYLEGDFATQWAYIAPLNPSLDDQGFTTTQYEIITTMTLDEKSEIIVDYYKKTGITIGEFGIKVTPFIPAVVNKRATRISHYIRFDNVSDFELFGEFSLNDVKLPVGSSYATEGTLTGIYLSSRVGVFIDIFKKDYDIVQGIKTRVLESGYAIAIAYDNPAYVQYNAIGGGKIMTDIFYYEAELDVDDTIDTKALAGASGKIFIISNSSTKVLNIEGSTGQPIFAIVDTLEFGAKNVKDVLKVQGGILVNTQEGIFMTNGFDKEWISEQINNVCIDNYSTSRIFYNKFKHELYYFPDTANGYYYLFSFRRRKWEGREVENLVNLKSLIGFNNGEIAYLAEYEDTYRWTTYNITEGGEIIEDGTCTNPWLITTVDELMLMEGSSDCFLLMNNLDLSSVAASDSSNISVIHEFKGVFDGNGYTLSGFAPAKQVSTASGFIASLDVTAAQGKNVPAVSNLHIDSFVITQGNAAYTFDAKWGICIGEIVGPDLGPGHTYVALSNIKVTNSTQDQRDGTFRDTCKIAIVVAQVLEGRGHVTNCIANNTNIIRSNDTRYTNNSFGGIVGNMGVDNYINKCMSGVKFEMSSGGFFILETLGGIAYRGIVTNSCYIGEIDNLSSGDNIAPMGITTSKEYTYSVPTFTNCTGINYGASYSTTTGYTTSYANVDSGYASVREADINEETTVNMKIEATYTGWDFTDTWGIDPAINGGFPYIKDIYEFVWGGTISYAGTKVERVDHIGTDIKQGFLVPTNIEQGDFTAYMTSASSNMESPELEKRIDYIDIDYVGKGYIGLYDEKGIEVQLFTLSALDRTTERLYVKLQYRFPTEKLKYRITTVDEKFKFYSCSLELEIEEKNGEFHAQF